MSDTPAQIQEAKNSLYMNYFGSLHPSDAQVREYLAVAFPETAPHLRLKRRGGRAYLVHAETNSIVGTGTSAAEAAIDADIQFKKELQSVAGTTPETTNQTKKESEMHYKNGREAKVGDKVVYPKYIGHSADGKAKYAAAHGIVISAQAGSDTCNAQVVPSDAPSQCVTVKHCLHEEDVSVSQSELDTVIGKPTEAPAQPVDTKTSDPAKITEILDKPAGDTPKTEASA